ncbi:MAG: hypothetical protein ACXADL_06290 [Candidatus Thorarchaeota archaeon]
MQLDLMQVFATLLAFLLIIVLVQMTVNGWPESQPALRFRTSFYLSLLGLFEALGSGLLMYLNPWSSFNYFSSFLLGTVVLGLAFPSYLAHRKVREEIAVSLESTPILVLRKSAVNSLAVALALVVCSIVFTWSGELSNDTMFAILGVILIIALVTHNISAVYYLQRQHSEG